jgi:hypothetical protein
MIKQKAEKEAEYFKEEKRTSKMTLELRLNFLKGTRY